MIITTVCVSEAAASGVHTYDLRNSGMPLQGTSGKDYFSLVNNRNKFYLAIRYTLGLFFLLSYAHNHGGSGYH